ncbi:LacI family DNA-binding transcriptional regulator [Streptomyces ardesiacus]|uniref:LacI family DNA-binding transcriptional regulator n=1 Tax=Streptomyces ardesiacus TaxID=285564 RepID=UPI000D59AF3C|nr:LacI family DNA-binding transcriptional regulator [Streptomyces ardesiacus]
MAKQGGGGKRPPGMTDVARAAGVSAQTVSRVLSGHPNVREQTRAEVLAAVSRLGYRRNNAARMLSSGRSRTIGVVTLRTTFYSRAAVMSGIEGAARSAGYAVSTATADSLDTFAIESALSRLIDQGVEGIVLAVPLINGSTRLEELTRTTPTLTIDGSRTDATEVVAVDQSLTARLATRHLLDLGHETVWHLAGPAEWLEAASRRDGWRTTLESAGRAVPPPLEGDWSPASGYRAGLVLGRIPEVTAVFVAGDEMAFGVVRALRELGRRVPEDISVVGVDDIELAEYCAPPLTTVAQPFAQMGELAVAHLLRCVAAPETVPEPASVEPRLVVRASTAAPPGTREAPGRRETSGRRETPGISVASGAPVASGAVTSRDA